MTFAHCTRICIGLLVQTTDMLVFFTLSEAVNKLLDPISSVHCILYIMSVNLSCSMSLILPLLSFALDFVIDVHLSNA